MRILSCPPSVFAPCRFFEHWQRDMVFESLAQQYDEIMRVLRDIVVPLVEADGGEVFLLPGDGARITVHLAGRLAGSPGIALLSRRVFEPALRAVAPDTAITVSSGWRVPEGAVRVINGGP